MELNDVYVNLNIFEWMSFGRFVDFWKKIRGRVQRVQISFQLEVWPCEGKSTIGNSIEIIKKKLAKPFW